MIRSGSDEPRVYRCAASRSAVSASASAPGRGAFLDQLADGCPARLHQLVAARSSRGRASRRGRAGRGSPPRPARPPRAAGRGAGRAARSPGATSPGAGPCRARPGPRASCVAISVIASTSSGDRSRFSSDSAQRVTSRMPRRGAPVEQLDRLVGAVPRGRPRGRQADLAGPAPVAVHDQRDVVRDGARQDLRPEAGRVRPVDRGERGAGDQATQAADPGSMAGPRAPHGVRQLEGARRAAEGIRRRRGSGRPFVAHGRMDPRASARVTPAADGP